MCMQNYLLHCLTSKLLYEYAEKELEKIENDLKKVKSEIGKLKEKKSKLEEQKNILLEKQSKAYTKQLSTQDWETDSMLLFHLIII